MGRPLEEAPHLPREMEEALKALTIRGVYGSNEANVEKVRSYLLAQGRVIEAARELVAVIPATYTVATDQTLWERAYALRVALAAGGETETPQEET